MTIGPISHSSCHLPGDLILPFHFPTLSPVVALSPPLPSYFGLWQLRRTSQVSGMSPFTYAILCLVDCMFDKAVPPRLRPEARKPFQSLLAPNRSLFTRSNCGNRPRRFSRSAFMSTSSSGKLSTFMLKPTNTNSWAF